jgi:hypothetical protein
MAKVTFVRPDGTRETSWTRELFDRYFHHPDMTFWRTGSFDAAFVDDTSATQLVVQFSSDGRFMLSFNRHDYREYLISGASTSAGAPIENPNDDLHAGGSILHDWTVIAPVVAAYWLDGKVTRPTHCRWARDDVEHIPLEAPGLTGDSLLWRRKTALTLRPKAPRDT